MATNRMHQPSATPILEAINIRKVYGRGQHQVEALKGVSLRIYPGEIVAIMGPSGCGKTTLLNVLSGMDSLTEGRVIALGNDLHRMRDDLRDRFRAQYMGFIFQSYNLIPVLTAVENVELPLLSQGVASKTARLKAEEALGRVGLKERWRYRPDELSGGQQQRVAIARAVVNSPSMVWADEPTGALDRQTANMVLDLIDRLNRADGITFVIVTHDPLVTERAHRVLYMDSGRLVQERVQKGTEQGAGSEMRSDRRDVR
jgi:putative ABC transport system ATP-binding protein